MGIRFLVVSLYLFLICIHSNLCEGCVKNEREALLQFKRSLNDTQDSLSSCVGEDCCKWDGVECKNKTWHVIALYLPRDSSGLVGSEVSPSLMELKYLEYLNLNTLDFVGSEIPKFFGNFTRLIHLLLSDCSFSGPIPSYLGNQSTLKRLDLSGNYRSGSIPSSLGGLSVLETLDLRHNHLTGSIPSSLGDLLALKYLWIGVNQITGIIPSSLGNLSNLVYPELAFNRLSVVVSDVHFRGLLRLEYIDFSHNSMIIFNMSSSWEPPFQLKALYTQSCNLGPVVPQWIGTQIHLHTLDMSNSGISEVPTWFWNFTSRLIYLDLSSNQIYGPLPILQHNVSVNHQFLDLSSNRFDCPLPQFPSIVVHLYLSNNSISGPVSENTATEMPILESLHLDNNNINGSIPASLCKLNHLSYIYISNNHLSGIVPDCWKEASSINILRLTSYNLTGPIPSSLGNLSYLRALYLSNNKFIGKFLNL